MNKLIDVYSPERSRKLLNDRFVHNESMLEVIKKLHKLPLCSLAAMCDGHTLTTPGNNAPADLYVNRASAVVHSLKGFHLPVTTAKRSVISDVGGTATQAVFSISKSDLDKLENDTAAIMRECAEHTQNLKKANAQKELNRIYREYGDKAFQSMIKTACANNDHHDGSKKAS